jgi:hypothetical protein
MPGEDVTIKLSPAKALTLFELLGRLIDQESLKLEHESERRVLCYLEASLESTLVEPLSPDYDRLVREAREQVMGE